MSSSPRLQGKVAASNIGETAARLFVQHGAAAVVATYIQDELGRKVIASINSDTVSYFHCVVNGMKPRSPPAVNYAIEKYGKLDILFSNAGIMSPFASVMDMDLAALDNTLAINLCGVAAMIKHAARAMVDGRDRSSVRVAKTG